MNEELIQLGLRAPDCDQILDALYGLGSMRDSEPKIETLELAAFQFQAVDPDTRRQAVFAVVIHWGYLPAFERLLKMTEEEQDEEVLQAVMAGISRLARMEDSLKGKALESLRDICVKPQTPNEIRFKGLLSSQWIAGELTAREYAKSSVASPPDEPDLSWFDKILS